MPTFGFEAEFGEGVNAMLPLLHERGLLGDPESMHHYHCDCHNCSFPGMPLRAQTDSSCGGEVISRPYGSTRYPAQDAYNIMAALQEVAVEADAEPAWNAGFHVHVAAGHLSTQQRAKMFWQWLRWEPVMEVIAAGAFRQRRDTNYATRSNAIEQLAYADNRTNSMRYREWTFDLIDREWFARREAEEQESIMRLVYNYHAGADRHSLLNLSTRFDTYEFRLWNSTRSAWRMELFTRLSCAWLRPAFVAALAERVPAEFDRWDPACERRTENVTLLQEALAVTGAHARTLELFDRQEAYRLAHLHDTNDPIFTAA